MLSGKWDSYLYNDLNEMITTLFIDAVYGKYHDEKRVITREQFADEKDSDAYIKYIWSFGNNGLAYLWGKDIEEIKLIACHMLMDESLSDRRAAYRSFCKNKLSDYRLQALEHLQALQRLEALKDQKELQHLEISNIDYRDYQYRKGDIVYCDVPYEVIDKNRCDDYGVRFDSLEFYEWVKSRPYQVFFSSYEISDDSFYCVKIKSIASLMGTNTNGQKRTEYLYSNRPINA